MKYLLTLLTLPLHFLLPIYNSVIDVTYKSSYEYLNSHSVPPANLSYRTSGIFTVGVSVGTLSPNVEGTVASYAVSPALPTGITLNSTTGVISGTPSVITPSISYTFTATNGSGSTSFTISFIVQDNRIPNISYNSNYTFTKNQAINNLSPTNVGGSVPQTTPNNVSSFLSVGSSQGAISFYPVNFAIDQTGNIFFPDTYSRLIRKITPAGIMTTFAGSGLQGSTNGTGTAASFQDPTGISIDASGNLYVADQGGHTIRKITPGGVVSTFAGSGTFGGIDATGTAATFYEPNGIVTDANGNVYIAERRGNKVRKITSSGVVTTLAGNGIQGFDNGTGSAARFATPFGLVFNQNGDLILADGSNTLRKITTSGVVTTFAGTGDRSAINGTTSNATFNNPIGVTADFAGNIYIADRDNHRIRKITPEGFVSTIAGNGTTSSIDGIGSAATLSSPTALAVDQSANLYVFEAFQNKIRKITLGGYTITPALPTGLVFDQTTGIISGTPTTLITSSSHTVSAANYYGSSSTTITITINDVAPSNLSYTAQNIFTKGTAISSLTPTISGGAVISYAISPALPSGLLFNTTTGAITGTPTVLFPSTTYTVTATNSGGSASTTFTIQVNDVPPSNLSYTTPNTFRKGIAITPLQPTISGGATTSYSINPSLPSGLQLNTTTGIISGTPNSGSSPNTYTITATNSGGSISANISITILGIPSITYNNTNIFTKGSSINSLNPVNTGGVATGFSITPSLPNGLIIDLTTGIISGTPTEIKTLTDYTVTASNDEGNGTYTLKITVNDVAPTALTYNTPNVFTKGSPISALNPSSNGGAIISYSISPNLPSGLSLNTSTGQISGTPTFISTQASYTITGNNTGGSTNTTISITVNDVPPASLSYSGNINFTKGTSITPLLPTVSGGVVTSYSINPALPTGLTLNTATGEISGTPNIVSPQTSYSITASNSGGSTSTSINITVNDVAPSNLSYTTPNIFTKGTSINPLNPTISGGAVVSYSINPSLPAGLTMNTSSGIITGTPSVESAQQSYTITATNSGGNTSTLLSIEVKGAPILQYNSPYNFVLGQTITPQKPINTGGAIQLTNIVSTFSGNFSNIQQGIAIDKDGNIYSASWNENCIYKLDPQGNRSTFLSGLDRPYGLAMDKENNLLFTEFYAGNVKRINPDNSITTITSGAGFIGGIAISNNGNIYLSDAGNNRILKIDTNRNITQLPGSYYFPYGVAVDFNENIFVLDTYNHRICKIDNNSNFSVFATGFYYPWGITINSAGNLYVGDASNQKVKMVTPDGVVSDVAGTGSWGGTDGAGPSASFNSPGQLTVNKDGDIFINDIYNRRIRKISFSGGFSIQPSLPTGLLFDKTTGTISGTPSALSPQTSYSVSNTNSAGTGTTTLSISVGAIALPVVWKSFKVIKRESTAVASWETSSEINASHFVIEHSTDGKEWKPIGQLKAHGNSNSLKSYQFIHNDPVSGSNYYRLKQIDLDGKFSYSVIQKLHLIFDSEIILFPNPFNDILTIKLGSVKQKNLEIQILDMGGKIVFQRKHKILHDNISIDLKHLINGIYSVYINFDNIRTVRRVIKIN